MGREEEGSVSSSPSLLPSSSLTPLLLLNFSPLLLLLLPYFLVTTQVAPCDSFLLKSWLCSRVLDIVTHTVRRSNIALHFQGFKTSRDVGMLQHKVNWVNETLAKLLHTMLGSNIALHFQPEYSD